jgi:hypothetical protein
MGGVRLPNETERSRPAMIQPGQSKKIVRGAALARKAAGRKQTADRNRFDPPVL